MSHRRAISGMHMQSMPSFSASWQNDVTEATRYYHDNIKLGAARKPSPSKASGVKIKNKTGGDLERGCVVQIGDPLMAELDPRCLWYEGDTYEDGAFGVLTKAALEDEIVGVIVSGEAIARVNVTSTSHRWAAPANGDTVLQSADSGPVQILSSLAETGEQECAVIIGGGSGGGGVRLQWGVVQTTESLQPGSSGCGVVPGWIVAREWVEPRVWDGGDYDEGDVVKIPGASAFSEEATYAAGDFALHGGYVYQAVEGEIEAGEFDAEQWAQLGSPGASYCADENIKAGPWDPAKWNATDAEHTLATNRKAPPAWTTSGSYELDDPISLPTAAAYDEGGSYSPLDLVVYDGQLYQANGGVTPGAFDEDGWDLIGVPGDTYRCIEANSSPVWNAEQWDKQSIPAVGEPVTTQLRYWLETLPELGSNVGWYNGVVVEAEINGGGGGASCGEIEVSTAGGLAFRFTSPSCTGAWATIPTVVCNDGVVLPPDTEPS